jgi:FixJ family two-component response regulator
MISIVDDDDFVRESLRDLIESLGYDVAAFESAERFLKTPYLAETSCFDYRSTNARYVGP